MSAGVAALAAEFTINAQTIATAVTSGGLVYAIVAAYNAWTQRGKIRGDAASVVAAAARELVDPLRQELAKEREEHALEVKNERRKVAELRSELDAALTDARGLRAELALAQVDADALRAGRIADQRRIRELEVRLNGRP